MSETLYDIVVVGCGPVGAVAAHLCGQAALKTLVVERETRPYPLPRAVHLDHEMMRIFQQLGLIDRVKPRMRTARRRPRRLTVKGGNETADSHIGFVLTSSVRLWIKYFVDRTWVDPTKRLGRGSLQTGAGLARGPV